jgi:hypothetical protein
MGTHGVTACFLRGITYCVDNLNRKYVSGHIDLCLSTYSPSLLTDYLNAHSSPSIFSSTHTVAILATTTMMPNAHSFVIATTPDISVRVVKTAVPYK